MIRAVLLDIGEVVVRLDFKRFFNALDLQGRDLRESFSLLNQWNSHDAFERGLVTPLEFHQKVCEMVGRQVGEREFWNHWNSIIVGPVQGIEELLSRVASRTPLYALTNSNLVHFEHLLKTYPWFDLFREVYSSHAFKCRKPEPEIYQMAVERMKVPAHQVLFVDDRPENVEGAKATGLQAELCLKAFPDLGTIFARHGLI